MSKQSEPNGHRLMHYVSVVV